MVGCHSAHGIKYSGILVDFIIDFQIATLVDPIQYNQKQTAVAYMHKYKMTLNIVNFLAMIQIQQTLRSYLFHSLLGSVEGVSISGNTIRGSIDDNISCRHFAHSGSNGVESSETLHDYL